MQSSQMSHASEYFWLFSLPLKHREIHEQRPEVIFQDRQILFTYLREKLVTAGDVCYLFPTDLPEFKTGTLDSMVTLNDQLAKLDPQVEGIVSKFVTNLKPLLDEDTDKIKENLLVNERSPGAYLRSFSWNKMKYRVDEPIPTIMNSIVEEVHQVDNLIKNKIGTYHHTKSNLNSLNRKKTGSLMTRNLSGLVKADDIIPGSDYMQSVLFVIQESDEATWQNEYERLLPLGAVPRSARVLCRDDGQILYVIVLMKKFAEEYIKAATAKKFIARTDFELNSEQNTQEFEAVFKLEADLKSQWSALIRLLKTNFGEIFSAWIHLKMLRLHVESILHYGLPPTFLTCFLNPTKDEKKIKKIFLHALEKLDLPGISQLELTAALLEAGVRTSSSNARTSLTESDAAEEAELWSALNGSEGVGGGVQNFDPFVKLTVKWNPIL